MANWMILGEAPLGEALFADPAGAAARRFFARPEEARARAEVQAGHLEHPERVARLVGAFLNG